MAYPLPRGANPLNFEEYDPTPFSGGYDQVGLYGRPKVPSAETCYPISEGAHHEAGGYGAETAPYLPGKIHCVDEHRPSYQHQNPPHGSDDYSFGRPKPRPSSYEEGPAYGSGHGRPKPGSYEGHGDDYGSGHGRPRPYGSYEEEGGGFGHGRPKPPFGEGGQEFGSGYGGGGERYGRHHTEPGHGGGGFGGSHGGQGYGGFDEKPCQESESFGYGGRKPSRFEEEEGGFGGHRPPHSGVEGGRFGEGGGRFGGEEEYGARKKYSDYEGETGDRPSYFGDEPPRPPADEGYGGYQGEEHHHGHHHKHHWRHSEE